MAPSWLTPWKLSDERRESIGQTNQRIVFKNGDCNVSMLNSKERRSRYIRDPYTSIIDAKWRYTLAIFTSGFLLCWLFFGFVWYLLVIINGDNLEHDDSSQHVPCVENVKGFIGAFLFSLESQHTIGYGVRVITEECPAAIFMLIVQSITGVILQAFLAGVVFAKLTRSKARASTVLFSRNAVICLRDRKLVLMFRVGDLRKSFIVGATIKAQLIQARHTEEGEQLPYHMTKLKIGNDDNTDEFLFIWPMTMVHVIDEDSPFYRMHAGNINSELYELVVYLEGTNESTGTTLQARYSYKNVNILWGHRLVQIVHYNHETLNYCVDFERFSNTYSVPTPLVSAYHWDKIAEQQKSEQMSDDVVQETATVEPLLMICPNSLPENILQNSPPQEHNIYRQSDSSMDGTISAVSTMKEEDLLKLSRNSESK